MESGKYLQLAALCVILLGGYHLYRSNQQIAEDERALHTLQTEMEIKQRQNESEIDFETRAVRELAAKLKTLGEERATLEEKLRAARNSLDAPELSYLEDDIRRQTDVVSDIKARLEQTKSDRAATREQAAELLSDTKEKQVQARSEFDEGIQNEQVQIDTLKSQLVDYRQQRDWVNVKKVQNQIQDHQTALATLKENRNLSVDETKNGKEAIQRAAAARDNDGKSLQSQIQKELDFETKKLNQLKEKLKSEKESDRGQVKSLRGELDSNRKQIETLRHERITHETRLRALSPPPEN